MPSKISKTVGVRFTAEALGQIRAYRDGKGLENDTEAVRELVFLGIAAASESTDSSKAAWNAGYENGRAEGLRTVLKALRSVIGAHQSELKLLAAYIREAIIRIESMMESKAQD